MVSHAVISKQLRVISVARVSSNSAQVYRITEDEARTQTQMQTHLRESISGTKASYPSLIAFPCPLVWWTLPGPHRWAA